MILCIGNDDMKIIDDGYKQGALRGDRTSTFGTAYSYLKGHPYGGFLAQTENLFITAHGNQNEIGNEGNGISFTPQQLAKELVQNILPGNYRGSIYVSACDTSPNYVNALKRELGDKVKGRIYGCVGMIKYKIEAPDSGVWVAAN